MSATEDVFARAKTVVCADPQRFFTDGGRRGEEWYFRRRAEDDTPSCHIVPGSGGAVKDFGDLNYRGSVIDVYAELHGMSAYEAAEAILRLTGNSSAAKKDPVSTKKQKPAPMLPIPEEALPVLIADVKSKEAERRYGPFVLASEYRDGDGRLLFVVVRWKGHDDKVILDQGEAATGSAIQSPGAPSGASNRCAGRHPNLLPRSLPPMSRRALCARFHTSSLPRRPGRAECS